MKVSTIIFLVVVSFAVLGNLTYGLLLIETVTSGTSVVISVVFTNLFILWLMPVLVGLALLIMERIKKKQH